MAEPEVLVEGVPFFTDLETATAGERDDRSVLRVRSIRDRVDRLRNVAVATVGAIVRAGRRDIEVEVVDENLGEARTAPRVLLTGDVDLSAVRHMRVTHERRSIELNRARRPSREGVRNELQGRAVIANVVEGPTPDAAAAHSPGAFRIAIAPREALACSVVEGDLSIAIGCVGGRGIRGLGVSRFLGNFRSGVPRRRCVGTTAAAGVVGRIARAASDPREGDESANQK